MQPSDAPSEFEVTMVATTMRLSPGHRVADRYVIERLLGEGGMGEVYAARDLELGETIALKVLRPEVERSDAAIERFRDEVRTARRVTHRNVARTYDVGHTEGFFFLTMELVDGPTLAARIQQGPVALGEALDVAIGLAEGLVAAHDAGVLHRDLKPANVLLAHDGRAVITDFGIASMSMATPEAGTIAGTPDYMALEQLRGQPLDGRADLFALGAVLHEMLSGAKPFHAISLAEHVEARRRPPMLPPSIPSDVASLVLRCLDPDAQRRPSEAREVVAELRRLALRSADAATVPTGPNATIEQGPFVPALGDVAVLAVLPLKPTAADDRSLADVLTDELVDVLSRTRGSKVLSRGATSSFADHRDPGAIASALGADTIVDGTVQSVGSRVRVSVRLVDARSGQQTWSERFEDELDNVFDLQDRIAQRIAEALRVELETTPFSPTVPTAALDAYWRAKAAAKNVFAGADGLGAAVQGFERALELAPGFLPAVAGLADALCRMWFFVRDPERPGQPEGPIGQRCRIQVERALRDAGGLPQSHLAAARMHVQLGDYRSAATSLRQALTLAPTFAAARAYLGVLQCEAGRPDEGIAHIELALRIDPHEHWIRTSLARHRALLGDFEGAKAELTRLSADDPNAKFSTAIIASRIALWQLDPAALEQWYRHWHQRAGAEHFMTLYCAVGLGILDEDGLAGAYARRSAETENLRFRTLTEQLMCEALALGGWEAEAFESLLRAADAALVDLEWLRRCPALAGLREDPRFAGVLCRVRERAAAIWAIAPTS